MTVQFAGCTETAVDSAVNTASVDTPEAGYPAQLEPFAEPVGAVPQQLSVESSWLAAEPSVLVAAACSVA